MALTTRTVTAFGKITVYYAFMEAELKKVLGAILGVSFYDFAIIAEPYSSLNLKRVAKALIKFRVEDETVRQRLVEFVGEFGSFAALRNHIAHMRWIDGSRPNSVKPIGVDIRNDKPIFFGTTPSERDWTDSELEAEADRLKALIDRMAAYSEEIGLREVISQNMSVTRRPTEPFSGIIKSESE